MEHCHGLCIDYRLRQFLYFIAGQAGILFPGPGTRGAGMRLPEHEQTVPGFPHTGTPQLTGKYLAEAAMKGYFHERR